MQDLKIRVQQPVPHGPRRAGERSDPTGTHMRGNDGVSDHRVAVADFLVGCGVDVGAIVVEVRAGVAAPVLELRARQHAARRREWNVGAVNRRRDRQRREPLAAAQHADRCVVADAVIHAEVHITGVDPRDFKLIVHAERHARRDFPCERGVGAVAAIDQHAGRAASVHEQPGAHGVAR
jgi:hypothetical protein